MNKIGIIPPHFLFFLKNEGIDITSFQSSNFFSKNIYDRMIVKFPFGSTSLDIQVIFDNVDISSPPDFLLLTNNNEELIIDYDKIIDKWNFKDSNCLYDCLLKIKKFYEISQEKKFLEIISKSINRNKFLNNNNENLNIYDYLEQLYSYIKKSFTNYRNLPESSQFIDIQFETENKGDNPKLISVQISYPLDCLIRSREINRAPILLININLKNNLNFFYDILLPYFVSSNTIRLKKESCNLLNLKPTLKRLENSIITSCIFMSNREKLITKIIESHIGFPLEIDTKNFLNLSLYFNHNKTILNNTVEKKTNNRGVNNANNNTNNINSGIKTMSYNFLVYIMFKKEEHSKFELQIIDCDALNVIQRKNIDYGITEREIINVLHIILSNIMDCVAKKK